MKLIDKEKVIAEIEKLYKEEYKFLPSDIVEGVVDFKDDLLMILDSLSTVKEVDEQKETMSECPYRQVGCTMYEGKILECNGTCGWVADHLNLKELKTKKGDNI